MEFRPIAIPDLELVRRCRLEDPHEASDYAFTYHYPFVDIPRTETRIAESSGCVIFRWNEDGGFRHFFPLGGGDKRKALAELRDHCRRQGIRLRVSSMSADEAAFLQDSLPGKWIVRANRDEFDYVYRMRDLADLPGRRYQSRRSFVNRFTSCGDWCYEPIAEGNVDDCRTVLRRWQEEKVADRKPFPETLAEEAVATLRILDGYFALGLVGGVLRRCGEPVAFAIGERLTPDMTLLAYEKALPSVCGAFQTGDREFVRLCCADSAFVNRSWDEGMEGLRLMKTIYHPVRMIEKWVAEEAG